MKRVFFVIALLAVTAALPAASNITDDLLTPYFNIRESFAGDTMKGVVEAAKEITRISGVYNKKDSGDKEILEEVNIIREKAALIVKADLAGAREVYKKLSKAMIRLHGKAPGESATVTFYCSMAPGSWMQEKDDIGNPYYGSKMLRCGKKIKSKHDK